jgi:hypothetical protein
MMPASSANGAAVSSAKRCAARTSVCANAGALRSGENALASVAK